jgi:DnaK suppressor protein
VALSRQQLDELKRIVQFRCLALGGEIMADAARARDNRAGVLAGGGLDRGDVAVAHQVVDLDNAELARDLLELRELEAAESRLDAGTYGQCVDCGEDIGYPRLRAQPEASRCLACQLVHDRSHAHAATPKL